MNKSVIYTEKNNCQDCYRCIKQCPVKAIKIEGNSASVINELCIYCGRCVLCCPVKAKKYREDLGKAQWLIDSGEKVVACIAPSWLSDFPEYSINQFINIIKQLGFYAMSETAQAAEWVSKTTHTWLHDQPNGVYISSCCPSVINYISIYAPELKSSLAPVLSPMLTQGYMLKNHFEHDIKTVFIGPCIAKKEEADPFEKYIDCAITFQELKKWIHEEEIKAEILNDEYPAQFVIGKPEKGRLFPIDGGMLSNMKNNVNAADIEYMTFSGIKNIREIISEIPKWDLDRKIFLELMTCDGGCIKGPGTASPEGLATKRMKIISRVFYSEIDNSQNIDFQPKINIPIRHFDISHPLISCCYSEDEIQNILFSMGKWTEKEELNCTGCGYDNCREFAKALLEGKAERAMCISYMRKVAQDKASVLLQKIPSGVVMVDETLRIIDCNKKFAEMLGNDNLMIFENNPGLAGADLKKLIPYHKFFSSLLASGEEMLEHDFRERDNYYHISIISIQKYKIACGIIENMREPEVQKELMVKRLKEVITQNMEAVQRIAYLLGENASFTESMLNSILDSHETEDNKSN